MNSSKGAYLLSFIILLGILYTFFLFYHVRDEVFFSGDGGVKALLIKQYSQGKYGLALDLSAKSWVKRLWEKGLYPLKPPFVYDLSNGYVIGFPLLFSIVSTPFYKFFGFKGLYIIPIVCLWILWIRFVFVAQSIKMNPYIIAISVALLIFSSPLTLYGGMFCEHTLGVLLVFCGIDFLISAPDKKYQDLGAFICGILGGLSVWIRSEALCMIFALILLSFFLLIKYRLKRMKVYILGISLSVVAFFLINIYLYQHPLGIHSYQVLESFSLFNRVSLGYNIAIILFYKLLLYIPLLVFIILYLPVFYFTTGDKFTSVVDQIIFFCFVFLITVPLVLPNTGGKDWGPRYLLILVPLFYLLVGIFIERIFNTTNKSVKYGFLLFFIILSTLGVYKNAFTGSQHLINDYALRVKPALDFIRHNKNNVVVVNHQWIAQELEATFDEKMFFLVQNDKDFEVFATGLLSQNCKQFLFITHFDDNKVSNIDFAVDALSVAGINFKKLDRYGIYLIYEAKIVLE